MRSTAYKLYAALPVALQNLAFTLLGLHLRRQRYGRGFRERLAALRESEWCSEADIKLFHRAQLRGLIDHCYETVPYYRELFDRHGVAPTDIREPEDLKKLPVLTKEVVRENTDRLISRAYRKRSLIKGLTSGTSGKALELFYTRDAVQFQWAVWWRHRARFGLRLGDPSLSFGARQPTPITQHRPPFWRRNRALAKTYLSTYHLTPQYMPQIVEFLNQTDFDFYAGYPSAMAVLAGFMRDAGLRLTNRPKYVVSGADALLPCFERLLRDTWGVPVTENYGTGECCVNFSKCEHGRFHDDYEFAMAELLDDPHNPKGSKRIVSTGLANWAMPLIRYETGDLALESDERCPCGRATRVLRGIDGRIEDYVRTPDGKMAIGMNQVFEWVPGAREMQIVQNRLDRITVRIVRRESYGESDTKALLQELRNRLGDEIAIDIDFVDGIPRAANGKFRAVVSTLQPDGNSIQKTLQTAVCEGTIGR
jgi:phenylacetate-CoA ligase